MPGLLARRLKVAIDRGNVRVVIATSTLTEGVNIPVNTLLIPSVHRSNTVFTVNEFSNLIGRAGRPGVATEGNALVVLPEREYRGRSREFVWNRTWDGYEQLVEELQEATELASTGDLSVEDGTANSALAILLERVRDAWEELSGSDDNEEFADWLEETAVVDGDGGDDDSEKLLDTLDGLLIAAIQEIEQMRNAGWRPLRAWDDGNKVYIEFPARLDQGEAPPLFVVGPLGDNQLVNYRVSGNHYIVDRLFAAAELRLGEDPQQVVRVSRTDGRQ